MLELFSGRLVYVHPDQIDQIHDGEFDFKADIRSGEWPEPASKRFAKLIETCIQTKQNSRPSMMAVMRELSELEKTFCNLDLRKALEVQLGKHRMDLEDAAVRKDLEALRKIQEKRECGVCLDDQRVLSEGLECDAHHFVCSECIAQHIHIICNGDGLGKLLYCFILSHLVPVYSISLFVLVVYAQSSTVICFLRDFSNFLSLLSQCCECW